MPKLRSVPSPRPTWLECTHMGGVPVTSTLGYEPRNGFSYIDGSIQIRMAGITTFFASELDAISIRFFTMITFTGLTGVVWFN